MILEFIAKHRIISLVLFFLLMVLPVVYFMYTTADRAGKTKVTIVAVPSDATIMIDGRKASVGDNYLRPGSYQVKGSKEGFADFTTMASVDTADKTVVIPLEAESVEARNWAIKNADKYMAIEGVAGEAAKKEGEAFSDKNPITRILPYQGALFNIGYRNDPSDPTGDSIIIDIDAVEAYRSAAIYQIYQWGYDPTNYKINFTNFKNQFDL